MKNWLYIVFVFVTYFGAAQTTYYVNDNSTSGDIYCSAVGSNANNGTTPLTPVSTLSYVINSIGLSDGDIVFVDAGTYFETDANLSLSNNNITITGAGSDLTFFDNNQSSSDANRWANITGDNITITGVYITGYNYGVGDAFAVQITGVSNLIMNDVMVNENLPGGGSSAIVINGGSSVTFNGGGSSCNPGSASVSGGGMNVEGNGNSVTINNYNFSNNYKDLQGGGGLYVSGDATTNVTVTNSLFSANGIQAAQGGGAVFVSGSNVTISGSCFTDNYASYSSGPVYGGAICSARGATLNISDCNFSGNYAQTSGKGGAVGINTSFAGSGSTATVNLTTCSFSGNTAGEAADIYARVGSSNPSIYNVDDCTFSGTSLDIRDDNSAQINIQNSGSPTATGSGINFLNANAATGTPSTVCPSVPAPCFSVLPIELFSFSGNCTENANELTWQTASEYNNAFFIVERAGVDGQFEIIEKTPGSLNSSDLLTYYYSDEHPFFGINYYRLSQVDVDGRSESFEPITVYNNCAGDDLIVTYVARDNALYFSSPMDGVTSISVLNMAGQLVEHLVTDPYETVSKIQLKDPPGAGVYLLKIDKGGMIETGKVLITK